MRTIQNDMRDRMTDVLRRASYIQPFYTSDGEPLTSQLHYVVHPDMAEGFVDFLIEKGFIMPSCKVGDTVYRLDERNGKVLDWWEITQIQIYEDEMLYIDDSDNYFLDGDIGKTVFLTKEEAERALAERKGKQ